MHYNVARPERQQEPFSESCDLQGPWRLCAFPLPQTGESEPGLPAVSLEPLAPVDLWAYNFLVEW